MDNTKDRFDHEHDGMSDRGVTAACDCIGRRGGLVLE